MNEDMEPVIQLLQEMIDEIYVYGKIEDLANKYNCRIDLDSYPSTDTYRVVSIYGSVIGIRFVDTIDDPKFTRGLTVSHDYTAMFSGQDYIRYTSEHVFENIDIQNDLFALSTVLDNTAIQELYVLSKLINHEKYYAISLYKNTIKMCNKILKR